MQDARQCLSPHDWSISLIYLAGRDASNRSAARWIAGQRSSARARATIPDSIALLSTDAKPSTSPGGFLDASEQTDTLQRISLELTNRRSILTYDAALAVQR